MTREEFTELLSYSSRLSFDFAKNYVSDKLPTEFLYTIKLNSSFDDPNLKQFDIYPEDNDKVIKLATSEKVIDLLLRENKVPVWIDISIESIRKTFTVFELRCAGRYSADPNEFYYLKGGTGPFGIKSPTFPIGYTDDGTKFSLPKKNSLFDWLKRT